jgi:hypothetical protein
MDIGSRDELELLPPNIDFAGLLFNLGVEHVIKIYDGINFYSLKYKRTS